MDPIRKPRSRRTVRSLVAGLTSVALALGGATLVLGCSSGHDATSATRAIAPTGPTAQASAPVEAMAGMSADEMDAAWAARPAFVRDNGARVAEAYAFALAAPGPLESMPCYCGCVAMDHRSNLDCFFKAHRDGYGRVAFEEHASFCGVCVDTALLTKHRLAEGRTLREIRVEVDQTIGSNGVEGTHTAMPPV